MNKDRRNKLFELGLNFFNNFVDKNDYLNSLKMIKNYKSQ